MAKLSKKEINNKLRSLAKGTARKRWPFNPAAVPTADRKDVERWVGGDEQAREDIEPLDPNAMKRGLHKLSSVTQTRVNDKGERSFLLHRGVSREEHDEMMGEGLFNKTSWTPDYDMAEAFGEDYNYDGDDDDLVVSAWIPESHIHHIPNAIGAAATGLDSAGNIPSKIKPSDLQPQHRRDEYEIIVNPHDFEHADYEHPSEGIHSKINQRAMTKSEAYAKLRKLKRS